MENLKSPSAEDQTAKALESIQKLGNAIINFIDKLEGYSKDKGYKDHIKDIIESSNNEIDENQKIILIGILSVKRDINLKKRIHNLLFPEENKIDIIESDEKDEISKIIPKIINHSKGKAQYLDQKDIQDSINELKTISNEEKAFYNSLADELIHDNKT